MSGGPLEATRVRVRAVLDYAVRRTTSDGRFLREMIDPVATGRSELAPEERRDALRSDAMLRRLGVRCLWRSAIVTRQLRQRGVAAQVGLAVSTRDPRRAHAECEVAGQPLRPHSDDTVRLR
jgi:hypothetical protein